MDKLLKLMIDSGVGAESTPFPNADNPIEIGEFRYDAKRMGGAPVITASVNYPSCLDDEWTDGVYAEFNGEKFFLKQTPTSSYDNEDTLYKHDIELVSERVILDNVYFFDTVVGDPQGDDKPVSNSTTVTFFGDVREFVARLNSSLQYSHLDYTVVVDDDIVTEEKKVSFEDQFFSNVLQEIYNTYEVPYYFEGKTIHIGYSKMVEVGEELPTFAYGVDDALISITKNNANYKVVNRVTGTGSTDNIPFYYPNNSPRGEIAATSSNSNLDVTILDTELYSNEVKLDGVITRSNIDHENLEVTHLGESIYSGETFSAQMGYGGISKDFVITFDAKDVGELSVSFESEVTKYTLKDVEINDATFGVRYYMSLRTSAEDGYPFGREVFTSGGLDAIEDVRVPIAKALDGYKLKITVSYAVTGKYAGKGGNIVYDASFDFGSESGWTYDGKPIELKDVGLKVDGAPSVGDTITQTLVKYIKTSQSLMPSVYRETDGAERFYNAINGKYTNEDGSAIVFNNPYVEGRPKEHIITVEDIKPTIKETEVNGLRIDMFSEFAYDEGDNDETYEDEEGNVYFEHPYFYGKLRVMDFNLFDHAIEQQPMTISFTSGDAGACNFEIGVTEDYPQKNPVQVDEDGNLVRDENGMVLAGVEGTQQQVTEFQERQQDTSKYEVWIALRKEEETYGILMPKAPKFNDAGEQIEAGHRPKACSAGQNDGDTFVILGINLPKSYILNAEKKLEAEIIKYLQDNNDEKFTFSINFSRIYFEENPDILQYLNENSKIKISYNEKEYELYVSSFSYNMSTGDVLPEIRVELDETLKVSQNALQNAISQVKSELGSAIRQVNANVAMQKASFIQRQADDDAYGTVNFTKGIKFGEGGKVEVFDDNSAKLTIEYLEVTKKASFTSLEIQEKTHVGGQLLVTPAAINCGEVEEFDDYYRCYFQTKGADGDEIFNQFAVGDQAICQTYNAWGSKYYWRLVVGIGEDYIDLSKTECDEDSDVPSAGDKIIQLGNQTDAERQNAIVIAAYGDGSPYIIQYKGINAFELPADKIVTKLSSTENIFTGKVHMEMGSDGLGDLQEFIDLQALAGTANSNATNAQNKANTAISVADKAQQSADTANTNALQAGEVAVVASEKAEEAIGKANAAQEGLDNMEVGGQNLLRNSGFTGDYLSEQLADESVLESATELYSPPFDHWTVNNAIVQDSIESASGKEASLTDGRMSQTFSYNLVANESYVVSFKAKGVSLQVNVGGFRSIIVLTDEWSKYEETFTATTKPVTFVISNATCTLCDLKFERGNKSTSWSTSQLDNASDRAYYQALKYLSTAIKDGSTDILGGLVLTNTLLLKNAMAQITAGANGVTTDSADDVAFWAGGTLEQATETMMKYLEDPTYQPTEEEVAVMAKAVITHGGRAILNDIFLRGYIYALGGKIGSLQIENGGISAKTTGGRFSFSPNGTVFTQDDGSLVQIGAGCHEAIKILGKDAGGQCYVDEDLYKIAAQINAADGYHAIHSLSGVYAGLRPNIRQIYTSDTLDALDHTIVVNNSSEITLTLPSSPQTGQEYKLIHTSNKTVNLVCSSSDSIIDVTAGSFDSFSNACVVMLTYFDGLWYAEL